MMHRFLYFACLVLLLAACGGGDKTVDDDARRVDTIPMMVMQIQKCSRLYASEYQLRKIVTYADTMSLKGEFMRHDFKIDLPIGKRKIAIPVTANVKAYVDFSKFSENNVRRNGKKVEIILPDPVVTMTATRIDHEGVRQKVSLFRRNFSDEEITHIQQQGRQDIINNLSRLGIVENARQSAARQLIPIIEQMGYKQDDITISFRKKFTLGDIPSLIKKVD